MAAVTHVQSSCKSNPRREQHHLSADSKHHNPVTNAEPWLPLLCLLRTLGLTAACYWPGRKPSRGPGAAANEVGLTHFLKPIRVVEPLNLSQ